MADARLKDDDGAEASGDGAFAVRVQGVESAWDIAGVTRETSARELKALLATASGIAQGSQRLIFQGRVLADEATLGSAGIRPGACTLHVAVRPPGVPPREAAPPPDDDAVPDLEQGGLRDEDLLALRVALEAELRAMAAQPAGSLGRGRAREGDISDFALGCAVGLFLGFVAMMCLLEPTATRRMRAGLFLGVCLNLSGAVAKFSDNGRSSRSEW